jgi:hypothetical protein
MLTTLGLRIDAVDEHGEPYRSASYMTCEGVVVPTRDREPEPRPDFRDGPTRGALLDLVREAWGRDDITTRKVGRGTPARWQVDCTGTPDALIDVTADTEAGALVAALEAAGRRGGE